MRVVSREDISAGCVLGPLLRRRSPIAALRVADSTAMIAPGLVRFLVGASIGAALAVAVGMSVAPRPASPSSAAGPIPAPVLVPVPGPTLTAAPGVPLPTLPATRTLQLASFVLAADQTDVNAGGAPWLSAGVPRIPAISQFDGGPLASKNCALASGAMLARLAYGIVTTGSQLRALQDDQEGGTSVSDVRAAISRGWGVRLSVGVLSPLQLRALMYAGAGAEISIRYGEIPVALRLQKDFTSGHGVYLDGFREAGAEGPAAYYVMDPLGHPWSGYRGRWWPADVVERAGTVFGSGRIIALWGFPGGRPPTQHPTLPRSAYPSAGSGASAAPGEGEDPMPTGDTNSPGNVDLGTTPPASPELLLGEAATGLSRAPDLLARCVVSPAPGDCPPGLVGQVVASAGSAPSGSTTPAPVQLLYATQVGPGTWQIIFESPPNSNPGIWVSPADTQAQLQGGTVDVALLDGQPVNVATVTTNPSQGFTFVITTAVGDQRAASLVGSVTVP